MTAAAPAFSICTFEDLTPEVREAGMCAVELVYKTLASQGRGAPVHQESWLLPELRKLATGRDQQSRIVASGILLRLGDSQYAVELRTAMKSPNPAFRMLAVEFADGADSVQEHLSRDPDLRVRWAAARRLAQQGSNIGAKVLEEMVQRGDVDGLESYRLLKKLNYAVSPPPGLMALLVSAKPPIRRQIIEATTDLPPQEGLPLLIVSSRDDATVIRSQVVKSAGQAYRDQRLPAFLNVLRSMSGDSSPLIRSQVAEALAKLPPPAQEDQVESLPNPSIPTATIVHEQPDSQLGKVFMRAQELVAFSVDGGDFQTVLKTAVLLKVGPHRICWSPANSDCKQVQVTHEQDIRVDIPISFGQQLIALARLALDKGKLAAAKERIARLTEMEHKGTLSFDQIPWLAFLCGRMAFAMQDFNEALRKYNQTLDFLESQPTSELYRMANDSARRVPKVCVLELFVNDESLRCHHTVRYYPEGQATYKILGSNDRLAELHPGQPVVKNHCQPKGL